MQRYSGLIRYARVQVLSQLQVISWATGFFLTGCILRVQNAQNFLGERLMFLKIPVVFTLAAVLFFASVARTAEKATSTKEKEFVFKVVERNSKAIALLGDNI